MRAMPPTFFSTETRYLQVLELKLELHGIFWFHTFAQPRDKYTHIMIPVIHNYPIQLAMLGLPAEAYAVVSGRRTFMYKPEKVWRGYGFYVYPAIAEKMISKMLTFSMGGTGYVQFKPQTRASAPDYTANQLFLPGTVFKTYTITDRNYTPPRVIRLGSKRYGVFVVRVSKILRGIVENGAGKSVTHPFNARDVGAEHYHGILRHYAGAVAHSGTVDKVILVGDAILGLPVFIEV